MTASRSVLAAVIGSLVIATPTLGQSSATPGAATAGAASDGGAAFGGAANADFDSLIDLITSTVASDTWAESGGGEAEIRPFPTGVWMDAGGVAERGAVPSIEVADLAAWRRLRAEGGDARKPSTLRCVSLPRLEAEILRRSEAAEPLDEAMLTLAGLQRVRYVIALPPEGSRRGDLVLAGPAGDWRVDDASRLVATATGGACVRLDDLLTLFRRESRASGKPFGCAITPRQEALAATQTRLDATSKTPLPPRLRDAWLEGVRRTLGPQDIEVFGIDPQSNAARVLVEADHHMKQLGLGAVEGVEGVPSYLDRAVQAARAGRSSEQLSVLRWWFAANYDGVGRSPDGRVYKLMGQGVKVLSENELLTARGERVHTGQSDPKTAGFAADFTEHFTRIAAKHPVYSELRNVFDLAVVASIVRSEGLLSICGWEPGVFADARQLPTPRLRAPRQVETMATCRVVNRREILAAVSGGVWIAAAEIAVTPSSKENPIGKRPEAIPASGDWWWDGATR